jgi:hypothetical protein
MPDAASSDGFLFLPSKAGYRLLSLRNLVEYTRWPDARPAVAGTGHDASGARRLAGPRRAVAEQPTHGGSRLGAQAVGHQRLDGILKTRKWQTG